MPLTSVGLAFIAGILSILSPCVLPLIPIVFGTAASEHRGGPIALAAGVTLSFVMIGLFVATIGFTIGLDGDVFRTVAAVLMIGVGAVLVVPSAQLRLAVAGGQMSHWADQQIGGLRPRGLAGQFGIGLLLGAVWSPCVGPTLGAASVLAAQGSSLGVVTLIMIAFGIGAAIPLVAIGLLSRQTFMRARGGISTGSKGAKLVLGISLILFGSAIITGIDKVLEAALVDWSPQWLTNLTTRI
jgi:cytochrome c-type biogenesis protein